MKKEQLIKLLRKHSEIDCIIYSDSWDDLADDIINLINNELNEFRAIGNNEQKQEFCSICGCEVEETEIFCEECATKKHSAK